jgi:hypothetical protein
MCLQRPYLHARTHIPVTIAIHARRATHELLQVGWRQQVVRIQHHYVLATRPRNSPAREQAQRRGP